MLPPDRLTTYSRWLRLLIAQSIQQLARTPAPPGQPPVLLLLDEFATLGRLEPVLQAAGLMAGLGLQLWPILQDLAQLRAAYGQSASTFLANAGLLQVSAPADLETAQWLSQALGNSTIGFATYSSSHTGTVRLAGRQLVRTFHLRVVGWDDRTCLPQLRRISLPGRDHQPGGVALFPLSPQLADGGGNAGLPRHRRQP
ncbi:type IV secretory system conjugative DNA transfer family protein [Pseudoroseomonas wenyumeiae]